jgi:hypothetical protein
LKSVIIPELIILLLADFLKLTKKDLEQRLEGDIMNI